MDWWHQEMLHKNKMEIHKDRWENLGPALNKEMIKHALRFTSDKGF